MSKSVSQSGAGLEEILAEQSAQSTQPKMAKLSGFDIDKQIGGIEDAEFKTALNSFQLSLFTGAVLKSGYALNKALAHWGVVSPDGSRVQREFALLSALTAESAASVTAWIATLKVSEITLPAWYGLRSSGK